MKKYILSALTIALMASCNNQGSKMDEQPVATGSGEGMKIAYVEVDSLMTQYDFAKDYSVTLQKKSNNARNTLTQKGNALQAAVNNFQQKMNNNGFQSREQAASVQAAIERQQRDLQELQARLENDKHYDLILSKAGDNILLAEKKYDITMDVINGLNKHYKPAAKTAATEEKAADDKKAEEKK